MRLPGGRLVRSRVVTDPRTVLLDALDRGLTGYAVLEPQGVLLLDGDGDGIVTFREGVPVVAYHTGTGRGGPPALADLAAEGPYHLELFAVDAADLATVHDNESFRVPPGMPAERLAGDQTLADRTRETVATTDHPRSESDRRRSGAPANSANPPDPADLENRGNHADSGGAGPGVTRDGDAESDSDRQVGAVEAFLDDEDKIDAIREEARSEAERRAEEWGFAGVGSGSKSGPEP